MATAKYVPNMGTCAIAAHNMGNKKAIDLSTAEVLGVSSAHFHRAVYAIEDTLHKAYAEYFKKGLVLSTRDEELKKLRGKCFEAWRQVLKEYTPEDCTKKIRIRDFDLDFTLGDIKKNLQVGVSVWGINGKKVFRRLIETYIGNLIAEQVVLDPEEVDIVSQYQSALRTIDNNATKREQIKIAVAELETMLKSNKRNKGLCKYLEEKIGEYKSKLTDLDNSDKTANETLRKNKAKFLATREKIKKPMELKVDAA